jgi:hypothetical protein
MSRTYHYHGFDIEVAVETDFSWKAGPCATASVGIVAVVGSAWYRQSTDASRQAQEWQSSRSLPRSMPDPPGDQFQFHLTKRE